jgi:hypothetical protein
VSAFNAGGVSAGDPATAATPTAYVPGGWADADVGISGVERRGVVTIGMSATTRAGLAVTAHDVYGLRTSTFTNVSVASAQLPAGWSDSDVGSPGLAGSAASSLGGRGWSVSGGGSDIWNTADQFHFASADFNGDGVLVARVTALQNTDPWAKAGVMWRDSADPGSLFADVVVTPGNGVAFQWRSAPGALPDQVNVTGLRAPLWVMLVRAGNDFSGFYSTGGTTWTQIGTTQNLGIRPTAPLAGLAVTAHNNGALNTALFADVSLLPSGWSNSDIGSPGYTGYTSYNSDSGTWAIGGGGSDIWNDADQFHFASERFTGDGEAVARVLAVQYTDQWAKAGVMWRDSPDAGARFVDVVVTPDNGVAF